MFDLIEEFVLFLMGQFYEKLELDLIRWTENLVKAVNENSEQGIETSLKYIKNYRELLKDLSDENMAINDFVGLIAEKYGFARVEEN